MKKLSHIICALALCVSFTSCNDYLDVMPENTLPTEKMWTKKSDVESVLMSGYYGLRSSITTHLIPLGELRAGVVKRRSAGNLDKLEIKATDKTYTEWQAFYSIIAAANDVLANAGSVRSKDATYTQEELNSHYCEAYFLRALSYFYIARNWKDAPLILMPYDTDDEDYYVSAVSNDEIVKQVKSDLENALALGAAKEEYDTKWETKGRATLWSLYALMADVCLWTQDFDKAIMYADMILESQSGFAPRFMPTATHSSWFSIFNPGNSDESIFELQYSRSKYNGTSLQTNDLPSLFYIDNTTTYMLSGQLVYDMQRDANEIMTLYPLDNEKLVRTKYGTYYGSENSRIGYVWKYIGGTTLSEPRTESYYDPNFIVYRVSAVMLMKAEALVMRNMGLSTDDNREALALVNQIRTRSNLTDCVADENSDVLTLLTCVVEEELEELAAEGHAWYDLLRVGRYQDPAGNVDFAKNLFMNKVIYYNETASENRVKTVLADTRAWYLPINSTELTRNSNLVQNTYYD